MPIKPIKEVYTDVGGNTTVEYSDDSTRKFNVEDVVTASTNAATGGVSLLSGNTSVLNTPAFARDWMLESPKVSISHYLNYTPTIYFDPSYTGTVFLGTKVKPYNTLAQVALACSGNMSGQVLGIRAGTKVLGALSLACYGSVSNPFVITRYGSGSAPVFSGELMSTAWSTYSGDTRIWKLVGLSNATDVFVPSSPNYSRLYPVNGANLAAKIAAMVAYITNPVANTMGVCAYDSGVSYCYLNSGNSPVADGAVVPIVATPVKIVYPNADGSGGIIISGIESIFSIDSAISITPAATTGIGSLAPAVVVGCRAAYAGSKLMAIQSGAFGAFDGILVNGVSKDLRFLNSYIALNQIDECVNNAVEINSHSSTVIERNISSGIGGNSVAELFAACSSCVVRFNRGVGAVISNSMTPGVNYAGCGIWVAPYADIAGITYDNTASVGNVFEYNYIQDAAAYSILLSGQNNVARQNTMAHLTLQPSGTVFQRAAGGATATGNSFLQNICYQGTSRYTLFFRIAYTGNDASTPIPTMNRNAYIRSDGVTGSMQWDNGASNYYNLATWRTATSQETNSVANDAVTPSYLHGLSSAQSNLNSTQINIVISSSSALRGIGSKLSSATVDIDGNPVGSTATSLGNWQG